MHVEKLLEAIKKQSDLENECKLKLLRLYGKVHEKKDFSGPYTGHGYLQSYKEEEEMCQIDFQQHALHHIIRNAELRKLDKLFKKMQKQGEVPSPELIMRYRKLISKREKEVMEEKYDIILATCNECAGARLSRLKKTSRIAQVIVDECGMAHEPETIAAVSLSNHVVLIGDHKQLQPVIKFTAARENGLSTSLFERYAEKIDDTPGNQLIPSRVPLVKLEWQYRMVSR